MPDRAASAAQSAPRRSAVQRTRSSHIWRISASCGVRKALGNSMVTTGTFAVHPAVVAQTAGKMPT